MIVVTGLFDHMVLQRDNRNLSRQPLAGRCSASGDLRATVRAKGKVLPRFNGVKVGRAAGGRFSGELAGLPCGGPYDVELTVGDEKLRVGDVLVGDVWILGGQSNMEGIGLLRNAAMPHPMVRAFYMDDRWDVAKDPIHNIGKAVDRVHAILGGGRNPVRSPLTGVGPGVHFGQEMTRLTGVPQGLIACAHGGTSMAQWDPKLKRRGTDSLYGAMLRRFTKNGGRVAGVVWYQGCSDATPADAPLYLQRMKRLVRSMRSDFRSPRLPFVAVQIGRVCNWGNGAAVWNLIQDQQRRLPDAIPRCAVTSAIDLPMDDQIHLSGIGHRELGRRLAQAMGTLTLGRKAGPPPISFKRVSLPPDAGSNLVDVVVEFSNVVGRLVSAGRPNGFSFSGAQAKDIVYDVRLDGHRAVIRTCAARCEAPRLQLSYGAGLTPYCNITDEAGRPLPVFGPVPVGRPIALTPFVTTVDVSPFLPGAGKLDAVTYGRAARLRFRRRTFSGAFCDVHADPGWSDDDRLVFFRAPFTCAEPMKLSALLGYDGPVKLWLDGKQEFHDPLGTNPAIMDRQSVRFNARRGRHEIMVALGSNKGQAWGIFLRLHRRDLTARQVDKGSGYAMPEWTAGD